MRVSNPEIRRPRRTTVGGPLIGRLPCATELKLCPVGIFRVCQKARSESSPRLVKRTQTQFFTAAHSQSTRLLSLSLSSSVNPSSSSSSSCTAFVHSPFLRRLPGGSMWGIHQKPKRQQVSHNRPRKGPCVDAEPKPESFPLPRPSSSHQRPRLLLSQRHPRVEPSALTNPAIRSIATNNGTRNSV